MFEKRTTTADQNIIRHVLNCTKAEFSHFNDALVPTQNHVTTALRSTESYQWDGFQWIHAPIPHEQSPPNQSIGEASFLRYLRKFSQTLSDDDTDSTDAAMVVSKPPKNTPSGSGACVA
jgi:hypothetical protein